MKIKSCLFLLLLIGNLRAQIFTNVSASESDAKIYVDGQYMSEGTCKVKIPFKSCVNVKFEKAGFLTKEIVFCNDPNKTKAAKTFFMKMEEDEAFVASIKTDIANTDVEIIPKKQETEAWKLLSQIVTSYFDVIEVTDKETGYMRTSWIVQNYNGSTVRTRLIIKQSSSEPIKYKAKLCSEISNKLNINSKDDDQFKEWDRILRKFEPLMNELQTRLQ